jgi:energy-converting hydrogenase Eha subunit A
MSARNVALFAAPIVAVAILVPLLNALEASSGIAFAVLGLVAVLGGAALGAFADPVPELPWTRGDRRLVGTRDGRQ